MKPVDHLILSGKGSDAQYGLKDATKDIDLVCRDQEDKARLLEAAGSLGFQIAGPEKRRPRLGLDRVAVRGGHTFDIFCDRISYDFGLTEAMWSRGRSARILGKVETRYAALADIFIMTLIANRPGDLGTAQLLPLQGLDSLIYENEVTNQQFNLTTSGESRSEEPIGSSSPQGLEWTHEIITYSN